MIFLYWPLTDCQEPCGLVDGCSLRGRSQWEVGRLRPAMLFDIWNTKKNDINRRPLLGLDMVGRLGWWGGQKMMPSIPLLSFKSRKGLIISHASLIPRYAKYFCNFLPTNLGSYLKWSHSFATFRLRHVGCRTQVRRCLTALEDSAVLVNAIDVIWRPLERRDAMAQGPEGCLPPPYWIFFSGCTR